MAKTTIGKHNMPPIRIESDGTKMNTRVISPGGEDLSAYVTGITWDLASGAGEVILKLHPLRVDIQVCGPAENDRREVQTDDVSAGSSLPLKFSRLGAWL